MRPVAVLLVPALAAGLLLPPAAAQSAEEPERQLAPVPLPAVSVFEEPDRRQLEAARADLDALLASPDASDDALARAFGELGRLYLLYDLVDPAEAALANAASLAPEEHAWQYYLGVVHQREGRLDEARERLARAAELRPRDLATRLHLGQAALDDGLLEAAGETFEAALALDRESAAALVGLGRIAYEGGRLDEAIERFERALALQPEADSIHHLLGLAYRKAGDLERAREHLAANRGTQVRFPDPLVDGLSALLKGASIHFKRGNRALEEGRLDLALAEYGRAAEAAPRDPLVRYNLGLTLARAGRRQEAIESFERAVELDPGYRDAHYNLAAALTEEGRWQEAAAHYERAWRIDPLDHAAHLDWAVALERAGRTAAAERELEALLHALAGRETPVAGRAHLRLAALLEARGEHPPALDHFRAAAAALPEEKEARLALAAALGRARRFAEAAAEYAEAARLDPADSGARFGQAMALVLGGRHGEARAALEAALAGRQAAEAVPLAHLLARLLASAPDPAVRDGARAVALAREVFQAAPSAEHAETLAMAFAEAGDFAQAVEWQRRVVARAESAAAPPEILEAMRRRLARYQRGEPERSPWEGS